MGHSTNLFTRAQIVIPGGVNSPVRAFKSVGGNPVFFKSGKGAYLYDVDDKPYIDYVGSFGPLILGHAHPLVLQATQEALTRGLGFGAPSEIEVEMAELITQSIHSIEQVRMVNSGTEATQSALRLARGFTKRDKILKFEGCYHGHCDSLLINAGSGLLTLGIPSSPGVPADLARHTLVAPFNDVDAVEALFAEYGTEIAAIIVEPVAGNMNCVLPLPEFLPRLRAICDHYSSLLIFDEVMTGFRITFGGVQSHYQVTPDITCLGKIIGGGLPVGAFGGKRDIMQHLAPVGPVYQAGTLSGNPIALTAGLTTLQQLQKPGVYESLTKTTEYFTEQLRARAAAEGIALHTQGIGGMFGIFFTEEKRLTRYDQVINCNVEHFKKFFHGMLKEGVYFAPSAFETSFMSTAHSSSVLEETLAAATRVFQKF